MVGKSKSVGEQPPPRQNGPIMPMIYITSPWCFIFYSFNKLNILLGFFSKTVFRMKSILFINNQIPKILKLKSLSLKVYFNFSLLDNHTRA